MIRDSIAQLLDPRLHRPALGAVVFYLAWALALLGVARLGWQDGAAAQRWLGAVLPMLPIVAMAGAFIRLHRRADEVQRAMHATAAAWGFVAMLLAALLAAHLERMQVGPRIEAMHLLGAGVLGWVVGLWRCFRVYR